MWWICGLIHLEIKIVPKNAKDAHPLKQFAAEFKPLEAEECLLMLTDKRTDANYCECHIKASVLIQLGTTEAPLDPDEQMDYKANRELRLTHPAFVRMQSDAKQGRSFSNIVAEYTKDFGKAHPLKIVGGQHRFKAIQEALAENVDEYHGVKVYFGLDTPQRLDVQLISNTNIAISPDLIDRVQETSQGPKLRDWCHSVDLLPVGTDFSDQFLRGGPISVRMARSFITNYYKGHEMTLAQFETSNTTPVLCKTGGEEDADWQALKTNNPNLWNDQKLTEAAKEFALLVQAQRNYFTMNKKADKPDYPEKAWNAAVYSAWAYVAGLLEDNTVRLKRHFDLKSVGNKDPLNAAVLAGGKHKTDSDTYRGLGYRTDPQERGRMVEVFHIQAESGKGITKSTVDAGIAAWAAKDAKLVAIKKREKVK
jgi:hypothetical protein